MLYDGQGKYKEAEELYKKGLLIREKVLGEEHLATATSYNNLAGVRKDGMEKDITINDMLANNDVFADIADVNLFGGERVIIEEDLEAVPTDSSYKDLEGQHHKLFRDTLKKVRKLGGTLLKFFPIVLS